MPSGLWTELARQGLTLSASTAAGAQFTPVGQRGVDATQVGLFQRWAARALDEAAQQIRELTEECDRLREVLRQSPDTQKGRCIDRQPAHQPRQTGRVESDGRNLDEVITSYRWSRPQRPATGLPIRGSDGHMRSSQKGGSP